MNTYRFDCRSTPDGFTQWACVYDENGTEIRRIDRDVQQETVTQFRVRVGKMLEAEGCVPDENQYCL
ncbi:MAG: hypothetical protein J5569_02895 [Oscillospiraceae bacterium]|nr:hypothetical protein [Oscillospiraceae bacterium]